MLSAAEVRALVMHFGVNAATLDDHDHLMRWEELNQKFSTAAFIRMAISELTYVRNIHAQFAALDDSRRDRLLQLLVIGSGSCTRVRLELATMSGLDVFFACNLYLRGRRSQLSNIIQLNFPLRAAYRVQTCSV